MIKKKKVSQKKNLYTVLRRVGVALQREEPGLIPVPTLLIDWRCESVNGWRDF